MKIEYILIRPAKQLRGERIYANYSVELMIVRLINSVKEYQKLDLIW